MATSNIRAPRRLRRKTVRNSHGRKSTHNALGVLGKLCNGRGSEFLWQNRSLKLACTFCSSERILSAGYFGHRQNGRAGGRNLGAAPPGHGRRRPPLLRSRRALPLRPARAAIRATKLRSSASARTAYPRHQMRRRVSNYLSYLALAVPRALALRPDIILSMTDPPVAGIAGAFIARLAGRPFVYNIRDLYPDMAVGGDIVRAGKWVARWESLHRRALKQAARVIVLGDDMRERILAKGAAPERVVVVRDGSVIASPTQMPDRSDPVVQEIRQGFPFVVLHAGNLGFYGAWDTLLQAAKILSNENTGFVFIGDGANRAALESAAGATRKYKICAVSAGRTNRARDDGRRPAHRHSEARPGGRRGAQQAVLNSRRGTSNPCRRAARIRRRAHRRGIRLRHRR